jgi:hypothetical protein
MSFVHPTINVAQIQDPMACGIVHEEIMIDLLLNFCLLVQILCASLTFFYFFTYHKKQNIRATMIGEEKIKYYALLSQ